MNSKPLILVNGKVVRYNDDKIMVTVWLSDYSEHIEKLLEESCLKISSKHVPWKMVTGMIPFDKLEALARIEQVCYIEPLTASARNPCGQ